MFSVIRPDPTLNLYSIKGIVMIKHNALLVLNQYPLPDNHPAKKGKWKYTYIEDIFILINHDEDSAFIYRGSKLEDLVAELKFLLRYILISNTNTGLTHSFGIYFKNLLDMHMKLMSIDSKGNISFVEAPDKMVKTSADYYMDIVNQKHLTHIEYKSRRCRNNKLI